MQRSDYHPSLKNHVKRLNGTLIRLSTLTFQAADPSSFSTVNLTADYDMSSHARDHDAYLAVSRSKRKRARALLDFERRDDDELGFRKNDIVTIVSQRDEHCWVGELNGLQVKWWQTSNRLLIDIR